jgi:hypothetical protein
LGLCSVLGTAACTSTGEKARIAVVQHVQGQGVQDVKLDLFCTNENVPDLAYAGVILTHNFAGRDGNPQEEPAGYVLRREGSGWIVDHTTKFTRDEQTARELLAGRKK